MKGGSDVGCREKGRKGVKKWEGGGRMEQEIERRSQNIAGLCVVSASPRDKKRILKSLVSL